MRSGMEKAAKEANNLQQQAESKKKETEDKQEKQKLDKIINETKRLEKHIEKALKFVDAELPNHTGDQIPRSEPPEETEETEVLKLQQGIYKELKKTEKNCKQNLDEHKEPDKEEETNKLKEKMKEIQDDMWDEYYMKIACLAALRSKDPHKPVSSLTALHLIIQCHTQVGACVVDREKDEIVGIGYNSMPYIEDDDNDTVFPWKGKSENDEEDQYWQVHPKLKHAYGN